MNLKKRRLARSGPIGALAMLLLFVFCMTAGPVAAATTVSLFASSATAPHGAVWLPGPAGSPGHLWISDASSGFCRVDVGGLTACLAGVRIPGQPAFDPLSDVVYVPDSALPGQGGQGVHRLHFNRLTETLDSDTVLRPTDGLAGNQPSAVALDPSTGALYVGFEHTPNIVRITQPNVGVGDPKVVVGNSTDGKQTFSMAFVSVGLDIRLVEADSSGLV